VNQVSGVRERAGDGQPQRHVKLVNAERKLTVSVVVAGLGLAGRIGVGPGYVDVCDPKID